MKLELKKSQQLIMASNKYPPERNKWFVDRFTHQANFREDKIFTLFTADTPTHLQTHWNHIQQLYPKYKSKVVNLTSKRIKSVVRDLLKDILQI